MDNFGSAPRSKVLVVMALSLEGQGLFEQLGVPVLYTGVGKVNAAGALARHLAGWRIQSGFLPTVLNFGTAGSLVFATHAVVGCHQFVQRDMDATGLGVALGETPFDEWPARIVVKPLFSHLPQGVCGTGDRFETGPPTLACEVVDMEAYALAKVCLVEGAAFGCVKYMTDGADADAAADWEANLPKAAAAFVAQYQAFIAGNKG